MHAGPVQAERNRDLSQGCRSCRTSASAQDLGEYDGVIVFRVARSVDEGEGSGACAPTKLAELVSLPGQLLRIPAAKAVEARWVVVEPTTKLAARRQLLRPLIQARPRT